MNKYFQKYYELKDSHKIHINDSYKKNEFESNLDHILNWNVFNQIAHKYWYEYNPFLYCKFDGEHKKLIQNDYDIEYEYLGKNRTLIDTFFYNT